LDETIASSNLAQMIELHVKWQLAHLGVTDPDLEHHLSKVLSRPFARWQPRIRSLLATLVERGFELGVVSNGCGNVEKLCTDFGYTPFLSVVVDSRRVSLFKPDPAIFRHRPKTWWRSWNHDDGGRFV